MTAGRLTVAAALVAGVFGCKDAGPEAAAPGRRAVPITPPGLAGGVTADRFEVEQLFAEVGLREELTFTELGNYAATGELETALWPAPADADPPVLPAAWRSLGVVAPARPRCRYVVLAGTDLEAVPGLFGEELLGASQPGRHWWYAVARCGDWVYGRANVSPGMRVLRAGR